MDASGAAAVHAVVAVVQPEGARNAVRVPAGEERGSDGHQVREDRHADREHERRPVGEHDQQRPRAPAQHGVLVQVPRVAEHANEEELRRRVRVQAPRDQEVGQRDPVGRLGPFRG